MKSKTVLTFIGACFVLVCVIAPREVVARAVAKHGQCKGSNVSGTNYFLPKEGVTKNFKSQVKMQGSGVMKNGDILTYTGKVVKKPKDCDTTKTSASGKCLLPYFSIAADPKYHRMGDIIYIPEIAEAKPPIKVTLPSGKQITHPGYFVVQDTGGAIKGENRFDFFTGLEDPVAAKDNPLKKFGLTEKNKCNVHFTKIDKSKRENSTALASIMCLNNQPECDKNTRTQYASAEGAEAGR